ncbi:FAD dependent oxidoreductase [Purpureocillium lilacinum]|uniref:FAD dependent oxidoreductase n=1 Tax=Purpureocillium lilacinum TaxID=33203 RepID=A0A179GWB1_PURLI|nr:FAD dependent oxidoreductase [Purpureocillium lilacinum]
MQAVLLAALSLPCMAAAAEDHRSLVKDVVIVGGGSSGSYAAVRLREDYGKSIALIERESILGGHVDSFTDPETGMSYDYGVKLFLDAGNATGFFDRLGVKRGSGTNPFVNTTYLDFKTGNFLGFAPPPFPAQFDALTKFLEVVEPWEHLLQPGYFEFPLPQDIPGDLLIPFGDFVTKHGLEDAVPLMYQTTGLGVGNMTSELTLFALQAFGASMARSILGLQGSFVPASGRNQDLYDAVGRLLGKDVFYSSTVVDTSRTSSGVRVTIRSSHTGKLTTILAKRLLIAIEPTTENIAPFGIDRDERRTLDKFVYTREYTGIIDNAALALNASYFNLPPNAAPNNYLSYPEPPFTARIDYLGSGRFFRVTVVGDEALRDARAAKELVQRDFETLLDAGVLTGGGSTPGTAPSRRVHWVDFSTHGPMHARVSVEHLRGGFFQELYQLQGRRSTWWTGGALSVNFQTTLWQYDDIILPKLLEGLD